MIQDETSEESPDKLATDDSIDSSELNSEEGVKDKIKNQYELRRRLEDFFEARRLHELIDDDAALRLEDPKARKHSLNKLMQRFQHEDDND